MKIENGLTSPVIRFRLAMAMTARPAGALVCSATVELWHTGGVIPPHAHPPGSVRG